MVPAVPGEQIEFVLYKAKGYWASKTHGLTIDCVDCEFYLMHGKVVVKKCGTLDEARELANDLVARGKVKP